MNLGYFKNKRILISGGNGYIAYNLIKRLAAIDLHITRLDSGIDKWHDIEGDTKIVFDNIVCDIRNREILESILPRFDIIYHFAAQTSVYIADSNPVRDIDINLIPLVNILDICEKKALKPVIVFSGTATEAGLKETFKQEGMDKPVTIYDLHKLMAETYLNYYCRKGIVKGVTLRLANVYGPGPVSSSKDRGIVNMMIRRAINEEPLTIYGDGEYIRDYIFINDVVDAFLKAAIHVDQFNGEHFDIGTGRGHSIATMMNMISERAFNRTGIRAPVMHVNPPDNLSIIEKRNFIADSGKFISCTEWKPATDLKMGIDITLDYFMNQKNEKPDLT